MSGYSIKLISSVISFNSLFSICHLNDLPIAIRVIVPSLTIIVLLSLYFWRSVNISFTYLCPHIGFIYTDEND